MPTNLTLIKFIKNIKMMLWDKNVHSKFQIKKLTYYIIFLKIYILNNNLII